MKDKLVALKLASIVHCLRRGEGGALTSSNLTIRVEMNFFYRKGGQKVVIKSCRLKHSFAWSGSHVQIEESSELTIRWLWGKQKCFHQNLISRTLSLRLKFVNCKYGFEKSISLRRIKVIIIIIVIIVIGNWASYLIRHSKWVIKNINPKTEWRHAFLKSTRNGGRGSVSWDLPCVCGFNWF